MGTTLTALYLTGHTYWIGHVGDSRAWMVRDSVGLQITQDHSVVWEQMRAGLITPEQAERHPMRNVLTRSVGNLPEVEVDVLTGETQQDDVWVLGTDGIRSSSRSASPRLSRSRVPPSRPLSTWSTSPSKRTAATTSASSSFAATDSPASSPPRFASP
jgi:hypothetical protein